MTETETKIR